MGAEAIIAIISAVMMSLFKLWEMADSIKTKKIPSWEELTSKNALLQAKIDAEK